jgi:hypothetical protein
MKHITKSIPCRAMQWNHPHDSKRVTILWAGINKDRECNLCGKMTSEHGWLDGVGVVHPTDWIVDIVGQSLILRDETYKALLEKEE